MEAKKIINVEKINTWKKKQENKQTLLGMRRRAECTWRIQEKFPIGTTGMTGMRTEKGMRENAHRPKKAGFQDNTGLFPSMLS